MNRPFASSRAASLSLVAGLVLAAAPSAQAFTLYDDFSGGTISPLRWFGQEFANSGAVVGEGRRAIVTGALHMEVRGWGDKYTNAGGGRAGQRLNFQNSGAITAMKATFTPRSTTYTACAANTTAVGVIRYRMSGFFFNMGDGTPGSEYNDVGAQVQIYRATNSVDAAGVFRISGSVYQCTDNTCLGSASIGSAVDLGVVNINVATNISLTWDKANHKFVFQKDADATHEVAYTVADTRAPVFNEKRVEALVDTQNCSGAVRSTGMAVVDIDNVYINP